MKRQARCTHRPLRSTWWLGRLIAMTRIGPIFLLVMASITATAEVTQGDIDRMRGERRVALVIGNGAYREFAPLRNPTRDARGVAKGLRAAGFEVILELDGTRPSIMDAVDRFALEMKQADIGLFYFAGHATQIEWRNFILPVAADLNAAVNAPGKLVDEVAIRAVDLGEVLARMETADNKLNVVILDACRDNPFTAEVRALSRNLSRSTGDVPFTVGEGLAQAFAPPRTFLAYSTAPGRVALDGKGRNSPYSAALIEVLRMDALKLEDVFKRVRSSVAEATQFQQIPWDNSSVFEDFYFRIPENPEQALAAMEADESLTRTFISP